jgi:hypothetical protein
MTADEQQKVHAQVFWPWTLEKTDGYCRKEVPSQLARTSDREKEGVLVEGARTSLRTDTT